MFTFIFQFNNEYLRLLNKDWINVDPMNTYPTIITCVSKMNAFIKNKTNIILIILAYCMVNSAALHSYQAKEKNEYDFITDNTASFRLLSGIKIGMTCKSIEEYLSKETKNNILSYEYSPSYNSHKIHEYNNQVRFAVKEFQISNKNDTLTNVELLFYLGKLYSLKSEISKKDNRVFDLIRDCTNKYGKPDSITSKSNIDDLYKHKLYTWDLNNWSIKIIVQGNEKRNNYNHRIIVSSKSNVLANTIIPDSFLFESTFEDIDLLQHEIYAGKGKSFEDWSLMNHLSQFSWYTPEKYDKDVELSKIEKINYDKLSNLKLKEKNRRIIMIHQLLEIGSKLENNKNDLSRFNFQDILSDNFSENSLEYERESSIEQAKIELHLLLDLIRELKTAILYLKSATATDIFSNNTHYSYSISKDQEEQISNTYISFDWNKVTIGYDSNTKLDIGDYNSRWIFQIKNDKLVLIDYFSAG